MRGDQRAPAGGIELAFTGRLLEQQVKLVDFEMPVSYPRGDDMWEKSVFVRSPGARTWLLIQTWALSAYRCYLKS